MLIYSSCFATPWLHASGSVLPAVIGGCNQSLTVVVSSNKERSRILSYVAESLSQKTQWKTDCINGYPTTHCASTLMISFRRSNYNLHSYRRGHAIYAICLQHIILHHASVSKFHASALLLLLGFVVLLHIRPVRNKTLQQLGVNPIDGN